VKKGVVADAELKNAYFRLGLKSVVDTGDYAVHV
jgi:hypothetical protein